MNSLLGGIGNALMNINKVKAMPAQQTPNILMQALGAAMRGESPQSFLQNLAQLHPELKQYDLNNLPQTAQQVCQQKGVDMQQAINQLDSITSTLIK